MYIIGHTRSLVHLIAHLVKLRDINVTFVSTDAFYDRTVTELARGFVAGQEEYAQRVRYAAPSPSYALIFSRIAGWCQ